MVFLWLFGPKIMAPIIRHRLENMVSDNLNARLTMDSLTYQFPYGVRAHNAAIVAKDEKGQEIDLLHVTDLELVLAKLPIGSGPLMIEKIIVKQPLGRLVMTEEGLIGRKGLVKPDPGKTPEPLGDPTQNGKSRKPAKGKPSDYFRLRRFEIHDGEIAFEDRRRQTMPRVIWKNLGAELNISPTTGSLYSYEFTARNDPLAVANIRGNFDIDDLMLNVERFVLALKVEQGKPQEQLPPMLQEVLFQYGVAGALSINGNAHVSFHDPEQTRYQAALDMPAATMKLPDGDGQFDRATVKLHVSSEQRTAATRELERPIVASELAIAASQPASRLATSRPGNQPAIVVKLDLLEVGNGDTMLHVDKGEAVLDPTSDQWRVKDLLCRLDLGKAHSGLPKKIEQALNKMELSGKVKLTATATGPLRPRKDTPALDQIEYQVVAYPRDLAVKPPKWPGPITNVSATIHANRDAILIENAEGSYHEDRFYVSLARIPMEDIEKDVKIQEISGSVQLSGKVADYPKQFEVITEQLHPSGTWYAIGGYDRRVGKLRPGEKPEYRFDIRCDGASAVVAENQIPLTNLKAEIVAGTRLIEIKRIEATALGGTLTGEAEITPGKGRDLIYQGSAWIRDIDLKTLASYASTDEKKPTRLSGKGHLNVFVQGTGPDETHSALDNFRAQGKFEALDGDFWTLPVVDEVSGNTKVARDALTVGQAAATFEIHDQIVNLKQVAISSTVLGVQGSGTVGFDGKLNLQAVAAPLADWKDQLKRTKIPILSNVASEVAGSIQKMLNNASKKLLYEFRVTGTAKKPNIETVPAPVLTEGVARIFGKMMKGEKLGDSVDGGRQK